MAQKPLVLREKQEELSYITLLIMISGYSLGWQFVIEDLCLIQGHIWQLQCLPRLFLWDKETVWSWLLIWPMLACPSHLRRLSVLALPWPLAIASSLCHVNKGEVHTLPQVNGAGTFGWRPSRGHLRIGSQWSQPMVWALLWNKSSKVAFGLGVE